MAEEGGLHAACRSGSRCDLPNNNHKSCHQNRADQYRAQHERRRPRAYLDLEVTVNTAPKAALPEEVVVADASDGVVWRVDVKEEVRR